MPFSTFVLDGTLVRVQAATRMSACTSEPGDFAGIAAASVGSAVVDTNDFPITSVGNNRVINTVNQQFTAVVSGGGSANVTWIALDDGSQLLGTFQCPSLTVNDTELQSIQSFTITNEQAVVA